MRTEPQQEAPSALEALVRLVDASQRLLADRLDLIRLETRAEVASVARALAVLILALPLMGAGWLAVMAAAVLALTPVLPVAASIGMLGGLHLAGGGLLAYWALGWVRDPGTLPPPEETWERGGNGRWTEERRAEGSTGDAASEHAPVSPGGPA